MKVYPNKAIFGWEGDNGIGEMLINQIINGEKTATCSFKIEYTDEELKELYATKGKIVTVVNKEGVPKCNIKILDIFETKFGDPDLRLVKGEGDGNDVKKFQDDHRKAWNETIKDNDITDDTKLIVELFELIETAE
ncbi:ASCH domain-containing protein [Halanaerobium kushneri]|uniref:ASCH domain-containing protein n=1 Tax=Halanaerobium kushneri TaxID=56779 RepID=UPI000970B709